MSLDQSFGFEFGVRIGNGSAMNAEYNGKFAAGGNAVAGTKITGMNQCAKLIAQLNVKRNVTLGLEMYWQHCLSPKSQF